MFENIKANEKTETSKTLTSIGQLKTNQIQAYLAERMEDATVVSSLLAAPSAQHWLTHRGGNTPAMLNQLLKSVSSAYEYRALLLLDTAADIRLHTGNHGILTETGRDIALRAMHERSRASFKIYFGDPATPDVLVLDVFVPVMSQDGTIAVGMIVLRSELNFLFQLLQSWPVESETAESLLVKKEGGDVLFLNDLRHQKNTAARLRVPLSNDTNSPAWPAMFAVTGHSGLLEASDYRGKRVLAYTIAVPDTPWHMVVKMDMEEATAHSQRLLRVALLIAMTLVVFTGIIIWLWWRKHKADQLANRQLQESEARYRRLHESMMDAFVMVDMSGQLLEFNRTFLEMLGYSSEELLKMSCADLMPEKWRELEQRIIAEQVIPHGFSQVYERESIRKNGAAFPVELKIFLLRDQHHQPEAMWFIVRDITERKKAEQRLHDLNEQLQFVREEEKARIAREIHDDLGGTLTALRMETYLLKTGLSMNKNALLLLQHTESMSQLIMTAMDFIRRIITGLRPIVLDDLGLLAALEWQAEQFQKRTGIECRVNCDCAETEGSKQELDKPSSIALFRISQEALTNVARHSGASRVKIEFRRSHEEILLSIIDNGCGMTEGKAVKSGSHGMRGMCERADQLGGTISFDTPPGGGFSVTVTAPLTHIELAADKRR